MEDSEQYEKIQEGSLLLLGRKIIYEDIPNLVKGDFIVCDRVFIKDISRLSELKEVGGKVDLKNAHINTFAGVGKTCLLTINQHLITNTAVTDCILGLMRVKNLTALHCDPGKLFVRCTEDIKPFSIVAHHLKSTDRDLLSCKEELMTAGYKRLAKL